MTSITDPPRGSFRPSMLINDTRYRSYTFQAIAFVVLALSIGYLINNLFTNLAAQGLDIDFSFLGAPAGYDINQRLIEYTSQSTNLQAAFVGILNTLLVAFLACVTATIFGVLAGVLRLSNNWLVRKLMAIYVEIFRNIPVLIWVLIIFTIMIAVLPGPREFRGDDPSATMFLGISAFTNRGVYIPLPFFERGFGGGLDFLMVLAVLVGSFFGARAVNARATRIQEATGVRPATLLTNLGIWFGPLIVMFLVFGLRFEVPELKGFNFAGGIKVGGPLIAIWFALSIYTGAFIAENVRAGIQAVSKGQTEAAGALGIRPGRIMSLVVLPQALRVIIPPLISNYLNITKNSSLAILVGYADVTATLGGITLNQTGRAIECILLLMLFYLTISLLISAVINVYNNAIKLKER
ncbi:amino acid ABC transporter permease [Loktanella sp. Alg231-35]|uniref:amino acid ABC transporter permease n=1 Tax=Loktanella sp. Alg231-35 TaxID=1922220 RepID=UPI000D560472|nr:ABC transporter permease subunit [Loktanella sp. Alg231-35]